MGGLPCGWLINSLDGQPMKEPKHPVLADGKVRYVGDRVALVVAETLEQAEAAAGLIVVDYEELVPVVDAGGPKIDQGALVRYLAEGIWFPAHATARDLRWEAIDATSARATIQDGETTTSGVFTFTEDGDLLRFEAPIVLLDEDATVPSTFPSPSPAG